MNAPECNGVRYRHPTVALHLHEYSGTLRIGKSIFQLEPGDITVSPPLLFSQYDLPASGEHLCIHFDRIVRRGKQFAADLPLHARLGPLTAAARERFWRVIDYFRQSAGRVDSVPAAAASAALQELLLWLSLREPSKGRGGEPRGTSHEEALDQLRAAIDRSLHGLVTVPELAAQTGLSCDYVSRLFARKHQMSIPHYLLLRRMELARHLLRSTSAPIQDIARQVGVPDPQYFNKQFRRVTGQSPSAYRTRRQGAGQDQSIAPA